MCIVWWKVVNFGWVAFNWNMKKDCWGIVMRMY